MLDDLQVQLNAHFKALAKLRASAGYPVYAIEHCLTDKVIQSARAEAAHHHRTIGLKRCHWLLWIVLAAEAGYRYDGEEYWPSLEAKPGEWRTQHDREVLRSWFEQFQRQFNGPTPRGRWAHHFSIIAWPITGALLPRYLQGHFARHLYEIRYGLSRLANASVDEIGAFLGSTSDRRSSRYDDFLEQTDLTGRIVLALRDEDLGEPVSRISPDTLARIVTDLEQHHGAGEYLQSARQVLRSARGVASASLGGTRRSLTSQPVQDKSVQPPRLIARQQGDGGVLLCVHLPDFDLALKKAELSTTALGRLRVRMHGETQRWSPGAALLSWSNRDRQFVVFPDGNVPIIELDGVSVTLHPILQPLTLLEERPVWLLRQEADNVFRQVVGGHLRPSQTYLVVTRGELPADVSKALSLRSSPTGLAEVNAYAFDAPASFSQPYRLALQALGLGYSLRARVEPVGLSPLPNAEGCGPAWAAGEEIMLRLAADFPAAEFTVELDGDHRARFAMTEAPIYISLGALPVGRHNLRIAAASKGVPLDAGVEATPTDFDFNVFEPRPWTDIAAERAGFRALLEPANANLESVLNGEAAVSVYGPTGRRVSWRVETIDASGHAVGGGPLAQIPVPMARDGFAPALKRLKDYSDDIDAAHRVDLVAELGELGRQALRFPHQVSPLRWILDPIEHRLRLIDETAHDEEVVVTRFDLVFPAVRLAVGYTELIAGIELASPGALFSAAYKGQRFVAFASAPSRVRLNALSELKLVQDFHLDVPSPAQSIIGQIDAIQLWRCARPIGRMAVVRKMQTLSGLQIELRRLFCGSDWSERLGAPTQHDLERAQLAVGGSPGFGSRMRTTAWVDMSWEQAQAEFFGHAHRYQVTADREVANRAITLAFCPWKYQAPASAAEDIDALRANRPLMRGAYLARAMIPTVRSGVEA
ncbi:MAG: hypothetical protein ABTQ29_04145 [Siculibacillus sp.]